MKIADSNKCFGCSACASICPNSAIEIKRDNRGFYKPIISLEKCVDCKLCEKVCPAVTREDTSSDIKKAFAIKIKDEEIRAKSTSGGAFTLMANYVLSRKGVVFGVAYDDDFTVIHKQIETNDELEKIYGSKYVQSNVGDSYKKIRENLKNGRYVLFSGTPCQVVGLKKYLDITKVNKEKLITCQIICHGVPSPDIWDKHLDQIEGRRKKKVVAYSCRAKVKGWHEHNEQITFEDGKKESQSKLSQNCKDLFYAGYTLNETCFTCPYAGDTDEADITIADFWGIEYLMKDFDDNKGTSLVVVSSSKGLDVIKESSDMAHIRVVDIETMLDYNHHMPSPKPKNYEQFWSDYEKLSYDDITAKYADEKFPNILIYALKKRIRRLLVSLKIMPY